MVFQNQLHANKFVLKIDLENTQLTLQEIVNAIKKIEIQKQSLLQKQESSTEWHIFMRITELVAGYEVWMQLDQWNVTNLARATFESLLKNILLV